MLMLAYPDLRSIALAIGDRTNHGGQSRTGFRFMVAVLVITVVVGSIRFLWFVATIPRYPGMSRSLVPLMEIEAASVLLPCVVFASWLATRNLRQTARRLPGAQSFLVYSGAAAATFLIFSASLWGYVQFDSLFDAATSDTGTAQEILLLDAATAYVGNAAKVAGLVLYFFAMVVLVDALIVSKRSLHRIWKQGTPVGDSKE
jgi:hypothetical protein